MQNQTNSSEEIKDSLAEAPAQDKTNTTTKPPAESAVSNADASVSPSPDEMTSSEPPVNDGAEGPYNVNGTDEGSTDTSPEEATEETPSAEELEITVTEEKKQAPPFMAILFEYVELFALSVCIVFLIFSFFFRVCDVRGESMEKTLYENERLLVSNFLYTPKRGDILVFHEIGPILKEPVVKRVIATGGEYVSLEFLENPQRIIVKIYDENMNLLEELDESDYVYIDQDAPFRRSDYENPIYVPEGYLFVMGDNRNHSTDSRSTVIGLVDERSVLGKVVARISPFSKIGTVS